MRAQAKGIKLPGSSFSVNVTGEWEFTYYSGNQSVVATDASLESFTSTIEAVLNIDISKGQFAFSAYGTMDMGGTDYDIITQQFYDFTSGNMTTYQDVVSV